MIEVQSLVKKYGKHLAVDDLTFTVEQGQIYGFLGPNGAGKSTTMNIMTGFLGATGGDVLVDGISITDNPDQAKRHIGYLPEQPPLYMDMTPLEYLSFAAELKKIPSAARRVAMEEVIEMTRLEDMQNRLIRNLSKGYRQRVGLAQALLGLPQVIILDEPMGGLDPRQIIEMRLLIQGLAREHTVILSSHILAEVQEVCDTIMIISRGKMIAAGSPAELEKEVSGTTDLEITVKCEKSRAVRALRSIKGITGINPMPAGEAGATKLRLSRSTSADIRETVFRACVLSDMPILSMRYVGVTLEDIFLQLTSDAYMDVPEDEEMPPEPDKSAVNTRSGAETSETGGEKGKTGEEGEDDAGNL